MENELERLLSSYCSFLIFAPNETKLVTALCKKVGWSVSFIDDPSRRYKFHDGGGHYEVCNPEVLAEYGHLGEGERCGQLLVINGEQTEVNNIIQLIRAANVVAEGFADKHRVNIFAFELTNDKSKQASVFKNIFQTTGFFELFSFMKNGSMAVAMAAEAWRERQTAYAILKLSRSYCTQAITPWSLHPCHGQVFEKHSGEFSDHVETSIAINLAFSAIEEMDLQVKSSRDNQRWIDKKNYTWNPEVLSDITTRLAQSGINSDDTIHWVVRGDDTEPQIEPKRDRLAGYSDGLIVRDIKYSIPDAIHACSYLRNFKTAHAFGQETALLGPYEVYNVQQVARLLILAKCGLYKVRREDFLEMMTSQVDRF